MLASNSILVDNVGGDAHGWAACASLAVRIVDCSLPLPCYLPTVSSASSLFTVVMSSDSELDCRTSFVINAAANLLPDRLCREFHGHVKLRNRGKEWEKNRVINAFGCLNETRLAETTPD
jgi:hypothetical protein